MRVLVTGGSGYLAAYVILRLLHGGFEVRATVRDLTREAQARTRLAAGGMQSDAALTFVAADLERDDGWNAAAADCSYVVHTASPFPAAAPEDENDLIRPARDGALRVLRASRDAGVQRVVLTSSFAAIGYGHDPARRDFDENDWTDTSGSDAAPYITSKTMQERAAWDFIDREGGQLQLAVVNPVGIFGPILGTDFSSSIGLVAGMLNGAMPFCPKVTFGIVDVRDVADLHVLAMTAPQANHQRFIAASGEVLSLMDVSRLLRQRLGSDAARTPRFELPDWLVRLLAMRDVRMRGVVPQLGKRRNPKNAKAVHILGWHPRSAQETIADTGVSLIAHGVVHTL